MVESQWTNRIFYLSLFKLTVQMRKKIVEIIISLTSTFLNRFIKIRSNKMAINGNIDFTKYPAVIKLADFTFQFFQESEKKELARMTAT